MIQKTKYYCNLGKRHIDVILDWNPMLLNNIAKRFRVEGAFTADELTPLFYNISNLNAVRKRLIRLYNNGWLIRKSIRIEREGNGRKTIYIYSFSESAKKYHSKYGCFTEGPLTSNCERRL